MQQDDGDPTSGPASSDAGSCVGDAGSGELTPALIRRMVEEALDNRLAAIQDRLRAPALTCFKPMLTERELAHLLRCDPRTVRRLEASGELPRALRIGGSKRWPAQLVEDWLDRLQREQAA